MIVWGRSISNKVVATGQFYCPDCGMERTYALRQDQKWGTIYWMPLIPLEKSEPYVECASCHKTYPQTALRHDRASAQQEFNAQRALEDDLSRMLCEVMALMAGEKQIVSPHLCGLIANGVRRLIRIEMPQDDILAAISAGPDEPEAVLRNLERLAAERSRQGARPASSRRGSPKAAHRDQRRAGDRDRAATGYEARSGVRHAG